VTVDRETLLLHARQAFIAAHTDRRVLDSEFLDSHEHADPLTFACFKEFAHSVWRAEAQSQPLYVSQIEALPSRVDELLSDAAAAARWFSPPTFARSGELAGTTGPVAYIDVRADGLTRLVVLHETAHLLADAAGPVGHCQTWAETYVALIRRHLGEGAATVWQFEFEWWRKKAEEKIAANSDWLAEMLPPTV
jgi:hypothetical protein